MNQEIKVSAICITYNQQKYIRQCLDSMLIQKTDFRYEIIVHDDASTDGTVEIVQEYAKKYPDMIRAIYQKENQFSLGNWATDLAVKESKGEYLAFCEGDDYWYDDQKLQQQFDYLESHDECSICFHNTYTCFVEENRLAEGWFFWKDRCFDGAGVYHSERLLELEVTPYSSHFYRKKDYVYASDFDTQNRKYGDMLRTICLASKGYGYCLPGFLSVYRKGVENSAFTRHYGRLKEYNLSIQYGINTWLGFDYYTKHSYKHLVNEKVQKERGRLLEILFDDIFALKQNVEELYIYGAGVYGTLCQTELYEKGIDIAGFVVSDGQEKTGTYNMRKVYYLSEIKHRNCGIIIAAGGGRRILLKNILEARIRNYCIGCIEQENKIIL